MNLLQHASKPIAIYNIHLKAGDKAANVATRQKQILELKELIKQDTTQKKVEVYLIAGDMNTKNPNELESLIKQL